MGVLFRVCLVCLVVLGLAEASPANRGGKWGVVKRLEDGEKIRGVNLGGWLVLEPWITPSIFQTFNEQQPYYNGTNVVVDEWTYWQYGPTAVGLSHTEFIKSHWTSWVTKDHLHILKKAGITHLRIPIGYWYFEILDDEPFKSGGDVFDFGLEQLKVLCGWAQEIKLKLLFDLHTAPGSQNGFDNSGRRGPIRVLEGDNIKRTERVVGMMSDWVKENVPDEILFGIEVLNEPNTFDGTVGDEVWEEMKGTFYPDTYKVVRERFSSKSIVVLQTAFRPPNDYIGLFPESEYQGVYLDDHTYQCFGGYNKMAYEWNGWSLHLIETCNKKPIYSNTPLPTFVGEFSLAVTDCTRWLTGVDVTPIPIQDNRPDVCAYYNTPPEYFRDEYKLFLRNFANAQFDAYESGAGWFFWNFRAENSPEWDFLAGLRGGWIEQPLGQRTPFDCSKA